MERALILLFTTVILFGAPAINANLSFASNQEFNITRTGCGVSKLCVETPANCDPAGNSSCLFGSVTANNSMAPNGTDLAFQLSGNSSGFIALGLTQNASQGNTMLFACAQNSSGSFFFQTATLNNTNKMLTSENRTVTEIRGKVNGDVIRCEFKVPNLNASSTRSTQDTTFVILLGSGTVNGDILGNFSTLLTSRALNLADPTSNNVTTASNTTASPSTTGAGCALHSHAVLLLLSMLTLFILKTA